ncbi:MAG: hypothetical protein GQ531_04895 [Sulfurovum sp.]|nr:hypothetical protein [Sulfurovum sp.]
MDKYKDKNEFFLYLDKIHSKSKIELEEINKKNLNEFTDQDYKNIHYLTMNAEYRILNIVKERMSNKLFNYINDNDLELDLVDLFLITETINEVDLHKTHKMSYDGTEYKREIKGLKKNTLQVHSLSEDKILFNIRLPKLPHESIRLLVDYFETRGVLSDIFIKDIYKFFRPTKPRSGVKSTEKLHESYYKIGNDIVENMKNGIDSDIIYESLLDDNSIYDNEIKKTEYYSPNDE